MTARRHKNTKDYYLDFVYSTPLYKIDVNLVQSAGTSLTNLQTKI
jgi:hypothetical protein